MTEARFRGRHALITGAGSGIGRATAQALAAEGADLTLVGRNRNALAETAALAEGFGVHVIVAPADVADAVAVDQAFSRAGEHAAIDLLVSSAGVNRPAPLAESSLADIKAMIDTNLLGTLLSCRCFGAQLLEASKPGAVVCVSSQMGTVGYPGRAPYCATKHAVNGLTKALAVEWARHGIRVNAVAPTFIETPWTEEMLADPAFRSEVLSRIPAGRVGTVAEVSSAVTYLLSDEASLITGHVLAVDGGWTAI